MVGNKQDLEHLREVELHEGEALASQYKIAFSEVIYKIALSEDIDHKEIVLVLITIETTKVTIKLLFRCLLLRVQTI